MYEYKGKKYPCLTTVMMSIIGGKWSAAILYNLIEKDLRYSELKSKTNPISERSLSIKLKELEKEKLVKRKVVYETPPLKVYYGLTEKGKCLEPLLNQIVNTSKIILEKYEKK